MEFIFPSTNIFIWTCHLITAWGTTDLEYGCLWEILKKFSAKKQDFLSKYGVKSVLCGWVSSMVIECTKTFYFFNYKKQQKTTPSFNNSWSFNNQLKNLSHTCRGFFFYPNLELIFLHHQLLFYIYQQISNNNLTAYYEKFQAFLEQVDYHYAIHVILQDIQDQLLKYTHIH